jgi:hypothetical protein
MTMCIMLNSPTVSHSDAHPKIEVEWLAPYPPDLNPEEVFAST